MQELKKTGVTTLLAEMNIQFALRASNRVYILEKGRISYEGNCEELERDAEAKRLHLAV